MGFLIQLMERGVLPDAVIRLGIRRMLAKRLAEIDHGDGDVNWERQHAFMTVLAGGPLAVATEDANRQHYELPPEFFELVLGPRRKYSCCLYPAATNDIASAEEQMLQLTCERAGVADGMDILELGCGWGSLTLWMAEKYPLARITAVSNSRPQGEFIVRTCRERGFANVGVITADMLDFSPDGRYDRIVSVEMFEHMRNYRELFRRIAGWLTDDGRLFVHVFCHREHAYLFAADGDDDWMGRYFFTGGLMPSVTMPYCFNEHLTVERHWRVCGTHYQRTCEDWLKRQDSRREAVMAVFERVYGSEASVWFQRWRVFFMACAELFGYHHGNEWLVGHYSMRRNRTCSA